MENSEKIRNWILKVIDDGSWVQYNDIHIDEISSDFKERKNWIYGGIACYHLAIEIIKKLYPQFEVELCFHLKSKKLPGDYLVKNISELRKGLDDFTPPSLYIYEKNWEGVNSHARIKMKDFIEHDMGTFYYVEAYNDGDKEFRRAVILI